MIGLNGIKDIVVKPILTGFSDIDSFVNATFKVLYHMGLLLANYPQHIYNLASNGTYKCETQSCHSCLSLHSLARHSRHYLQCVHFQVM